MSIVPSDDAHEPISPETWVELRFRYPNAEKIAVALMLARDVATFEALYRGEPIDAGRLDPRALAHAREATLVQLVRPVDLLGDVAA